MSLGSGELRPPFEHAGAHVAIDTWIPTRDR